MPDLKELDRARERWRLTRQRMGQSTDPGARSVGLARRIQDLSARLLILPGDPFATALSFDDEFWGWWTEHPPTPFGGPRSLDEHRTDRRWCGKVHARLGEVNDPRSAPKWRYRDRLRSGLVRWRRNPVFRAGAHGCAGLDWCFDAGRVRRSLWPLRSVGVDPHLLRHGKRLPRWVRPGLGKAASLWAV